MSGVSGGGVATVTVWMEAISFEERGAVPDEIEIVYEVDIASGAGGL